MFGYCRSVVTCLQCAGILTASSLLQHTETVSCASGLQTSPRILQSLGNSMVRFHTITHSLTHTQTDTHTHTLTHTDTDTQSKSKASRCLGKVTRSWSSQGTCAPSRYYVPVLCKLLEPGQGARRSTDCASHCRCGHPIVPQVPLVNNETQSVRFAPQYSWFR